MSKIRCPRCGSKDCKERLITLEKIADAAIEFGVELGIEAVKSVFTGKKMDYQRAADNYDAKSTFNSGLRNKKKPYRCKTCGYTWESRQ